MIRLTPAWSELVALPAQALIALDYDGTLAPIVSDPARAEAHADASSVLAGLVDAGFCVAIVTGRPVTDVLRLGSGFADVPSLTIRGHYGMQRWSDGVITEPDDHPGMEPARAAVASLVEAAPAGVAMEDKGHSVAVHTRNADDPASTFDRLRPEAERIASENDLELVPGRYVLELRPPGVDKGGAMRELVNETAARAVLFAGDDLGDLPAVEALRDLDVAAFVVCSDSPETPDALRDAADLVVDGPDGVIALLTELAAAAGPGR